MTISISNPVEATQIFTVLFSLALLLSFRRRTKSEPFPISVSHELKGLSILAIIFAHIGYALVSDHEFLFPLSILAGVGVDLFLFLSGYGLVVSSMKKNLGAGDFYRVRIIKLFIPLWIIITTFFTLDFLALGKTYSWKYIVSAFIGFFPSADLYSDLNSPLWYFTFILFYYLVFPLVFSKKRPWLSAIVIYAISYFILRQNPAFLNKVVGFYELHTMAFPFGMIVGGMFYDPYCYVETFIPSRIASFLKTHKALAHLQDIFDRFRRNISSSALRIAGQLGYCMVVIALLYIIIYIAFHSGMDKPPVVRQLISMVAVSATVALFLIKKTESRLLHWFGLYSYEIYLFHWPILSRYDLFFRFLPGWLAMAAYLILFLVLGRLLKKEVKVLFRDILMSGLKAARLRS